MKRNRIAAMIQKADSKMTPPQRKLQYNDSAVSLEGQLYTDFFFGRPHFGDEPDIDEVEHAIMLALDEPICVEGNGSKVEGDFERITENNVDRVQVAFEDVIALREMRGHGVRLKGRLWHSFTGHHHTSILISIEETPSVIDDRDAFPNQQLVSSGSGFLLGGEGLVGTAAHVLEGVKNVSVTRGMLRQHATVLAVDEEMDLAILKIEPRGTLVNVLKHREKKVRPTRTWMRPKLGERVYAFGFPLGGRLTHSLNMTEGLISSEAGLEGHQFQISAAIQPGNSGGPVFDAYGNLIGVAVSSLEPAQDVNFSIQNLNFCVLGHFLESFCGTHGASLIGKESRELILPPTVLAEAALHFCVEVEGWGDPDGS